MDAKRLKRGFYTTLVIAAFALGVATLVLLAWTSQDPQEFGRLHGLLLAVNAAGVFILLALIMGNLFRLVRDRWRGVPGTKLKVRMLTAIVGLAVVPLIIAYLFAVQFLIFCLLSMMLLAYLIF